MKRLALPCLICCLTITVLAIWQKSHADEPPVHIAEDLPPLKARATPGGILHRHIGTYVTIEGVRQKPGMMVPENSLVIDTVNGRKLPHSFSMEVKNCQLPVETRCVIKGYELGAFVGVPSAEFSRAAEVGYDANAMRRNTQTIFHWQPHFVPLVFVEPQGVTVTTKMSLRGLSQR